MNNTFTSNRVPSLDLARILAMLMMIAGHTFFSLIEPSQINTNAAPWNWWEFMRGATAPIFLTVSGIVQVFANKRDENGKLSQTTILKRLGTAFMLIGIGYLLVFPVDKIFDFFYLQSSQLPKFYAVNVLQLIGVSLLMVLAVFVFTRSNKTFFWASISLAVIFTVLTPLVNKMNWFEVLPYPIASYLDYRNGSIFTLFPFTAYLFYGMAFGAKLKEVEPHRRINFIITTSLILTPVFYIAGYYLFKFEWNFIANTPIPYKASAGFIFTRFAVVAIALAITGFITKKFMHLQDFFTFFGQKALYVYVLHFFVLYGTAMTPGVFQFYGGASSVALAFANIPIVIFGTLLLTVLINQIINRDTRFALIYKFSISVYLIYVLFI
ncbi:MAG: hypothetical protein A2X64_02185 [Ignavibacteria bacterium GWF2_33_9]|nr:MAG: hypothetical protein A2X64_02185 [Ignavibacteria bacterium GWF2_33_9]